MDADEGGEDLADRDPVGGRVTGDSFQCVDATKAHIKLAVTEVVDRTGVPLSDLPLSGCVVLPVGEVRTDQQERPAEALQQGCADLVVHPRFLKGALINKPAWEQQHHPQQYEDHNHPEDHRQEPTRCP